MGNSPPSRRFTALNNLRHFVVLILNMNPGSPSKIDENSPFRLILVSNRLPVQLVKKNGEVAIKQSDGGLVTALKNYFEQESTKDT
jgi:hypothetical protein